MGRAVQSLGEWGSWNDYQELQIDFQEKTSTIALDAGSIARTSATLTLANYPGDWWLKRTSPADTNCKAKTTLTVSLSGLTPGSSHTYKVYSDSGCATEIASETFSTFLSTLTASNVGVNSARLTLSDHTGDWWGKRTVPANNACTSKGTASTHDLSGLAAGTETATNANGGPRNRWD